MSLPLRTRHGTMLSFRLTEIWWWPHIAASITPSPLPQDEEHHEANERKTYNDARNCYSSCGACAKTRRRL